MIKKPIQRLFRHLRRGVGVTAAITAVSLTSALVGLAVVGDLGHRTGTAPAAATDPLAHLSADAARHGWGAQAIALIHADMFAGMAIAPANACGMGATSCYKCHNGKQAEAPDTKPWHVQHIPVNYSCNGCHQGNPRLMNKNIAHSGMLANPLTDTQKACATCHTDPSKLANYVATYKQAYQKKD